MIPTAMLNHSYSFSGIFGEHQTPVAEFQLQQAAFPAEFLFDDGVEAEGKLVTLVVVRVKLAVFHKDLADDEIGVPGMLVLAAVTLPLQLDRNISLKINAQVQSYHLVRRNERNAVSYWRLNSNSRFILSASFFCRR